jgi:hypothetical protein
MCLRLGCLPLLIRAEGREVEHSHFQVGIRKYAEFTARNLFVRAISHRPKPILLLESATGPGWPGLRINLYRQTPLHAPTC